MQKAQRQAFGRLGIALIASLIVHFVALGHWRDWHLRPSPQALLADLVSTSAGSTTPLEVDLASLHPPAPAAAVLNSGQVSPVAPPVASLESSANSNDVKSSAKVAAAPARQAPVAGKASNSSEHPAPQFFGPHDVDIRAYPLNRPPVDDFTSQYYSQDEVVRLRVFVGADGQVSHVEALPETTAPADFVEHMKSSISATLFRPAMRAGVAVDSYFDVDLSIQSSRPPLKVN